MPRAPRGRTGSERGPGRGRNGEGTGAANPNREPTRKPASQRESIEVMRRQMPDIGRRREGAKRTNVRPLAMNEISDAQKHRQPPDPHRYVDIKMPTQVVGQHSNGDLSIQYKPPSMLLGGLRF